LLKGFSNTLVHLSLHSFGFGGSLFGFGSCSTGSFFLSESFGLFLSGQSFSSFLFVLLLLGGFSLSLLFSLLSF
jgi:hypothetical protein